MNKILLICALSILLLVISSLSSAKILIRSRRQVEREGNLNETTTVLAGDGERGPEYETIQPDDDKTDVMEVDFDPEDGTFAFGGRFPSFFNDNFNTHFDQLFRQMTKRFEDMARGMFERFNSTSSKYPDNYNGTKDEIVTIDGKQFLKKEHVIKKSDNNINMFITSTTYEPIEDKKNESEI